MNTKRVNDEKTDPSMPPSLHGKVPNDSPLSIRKKLLNQGVLPCGNTSTFDPAHLNFGFDGAVVIPN